MMLRSNTGEEVRVLTMRGSLQELPLRVKEEKTAETRPYRPPKREDPIRTRVAPSSIATAKSWLIPMDSSGSSQRW